MGGLYEIDNCAVELYNVLQISCLAHGEQIQVSKKKYNIVCVLYRKENTPTQITKTLYNSTSHLSYTL